MSVLLIIHLLAIGVWLGVVGAEFAIEFRGMRDEQAMRAAAELHYKTDLWVEVPAFVTVLVTGLLMLGDAALGNVFIAKLVFALLAIFFNGICVYAVAKRRKSLLANDRMGIKSADRAMKIGSAVIPTFLIAFSLGLYLGIG